ncbi:MAG: hypothetical protein ACFFCQ_16380, partial [Promethearchaeota archaeon]
MTYQYKRIVILIFILLFIGTSSISFTPFIEDQKHTSTPVESISEPPESSFNSQLKDALPVKDHGNWDIKTDFNSRNSLQRYLKASNNKQAILSKSLMELLQSTPRTMWEDVQTKIIVTYNTNDEMIPQQFSKYNPDLMKTLPIAIIKTTLSSINDIQTIPAVTGVYLDNYIPLSEEWKPQAILGSNDILTYPTESIIGA